MPDLPYRGASGDVRVANRILVDFRAPASGKSYFLASLTWQLRNILPRHFTFTFADVDPAFNRTINEYEEMLFLSAEADKLVAIRKTELQGEMYTTVMVGNQSITYPRPFVFRLKPTKQHPNFEHAQELGRLLCLYDNAGEHFLPGQDTTSSPVTRHLAQSRRFVVLVRSDPGSAFSQGVYRTIVRSPIDHVHTYQPTRVDPL